MGKIEPLHKVEARVLGVLIEKQTTTPDSYPLSLNSLVTGCNQKSNRDPVTEFDERSVTDALRDLQLNRLATENHTSGARVVKYAHNAGARLELEPPALAVIAELMLRGPQTPGDLRARASRMAPLPDLPTLERVLGQLESRGMVVRIAPAPGSRAPRWAQTLSPNLHPIDGAVSSAPSATPAVAARPAHQPANAPAAGATATTAPAATGDDLAARVTALERQLAALSEQLDTLRAQLGDDAG